MISLINLNRHVIFITGLNMKNRKLFEFRQLTVEHFVAALGVEDMMDTVDLLKQLEINYKLISNDLEFASHKLETHLAAASR